MLLAGALLVGGANQADAALLSGVNALKEWNLIVFNNVTSSSEVEGRSFIGGSLDGNSSNYNIAPGNIASQNNNPALTVVGNVTGSTKNLNNAGGASIGGNLASQNGFNLNGGNQTLNIGGSSTQTNVNQNTVNANLGSSFTNTLIQQRDLLISSLGSGTNGLASNLKALTNTGTGTIANNRLTINATNTNALNVFSVTSSQLNSIGELSVTNASGATTVINVSGTNITLNDNFISPAAELGRNVIWNFYEATSLSLSTAFYGTILAPNAAVTTSNFVEGTLVANSLTQNGEVHMDSFQGDLSSVGGSVSATPEPSTWAMLILGFGLIGAILRQRRPAVTVRPALA
jgi:choice-of-anchor A domain-containing protein